MLDGDVGLRPPGPLGGPRAWRGEALTLQPERWIWRLSEEDLEALEDATMAYQAGGQPASDLSAQSFPLPSLAKKIAAMREALLEGKGFQVIRGLPVHRYERSALITMFLGLGTHLGTPRPQNAAGHLLGHVRDTGKEASNPAARIYETSARQTFHTDSADVVGLLCLQDAMEGGDSLVVSAVTLHDVLADSAPDLLPLLFEALATDRRGEVPEGALPYLTIPPLTWYRGELTVFYQRQYIESAQRFPDAPRLAESHRAALDAFDAAANDRALHLRMRLQPGDMQFVYNHAMLHDRTGFTDWPDLEKRRHMLRLWLSVPGDRALDPRFKQRYGDLTPGRRGGIAIQGSRLHVPLD
ncbi:MAG: TauD/TfdA family dioxygenase [Shimia sp.]